MPQALTHVHRSLPGVAWSHPVGPDLFLRGREYIRGERPLLHFVHGNGFSGMTYWPLLGRLHDHYDLCLHDTQGHGHSDDGARFPGWNATADRIVEFMTQRRALWGARTARCCHSSIIQHTAAGSTTRVAINQRRGLPPF